MGGCLLQTAFAIGAGPVPGEMQNAGHKKTRQEAGFFLVRQLPLNPTFP